MTIRRIYNKAIYFFDISVLLQTGEINTDVLLYDSGGLSRRKHVYNRRQGENNDDPSRGLKASPVHSDTDVTEAYERSGDVPPADR